MKIVINSCWGGFSLSDKAIEYFGKLKGMNLVQYPSSISMLGRLWYEVEKETSEEIPFSNRDIKRDDLDLVRVVEEIGQEASGKYSCLKVVEIPDDVEWVIEEYDGKEWVSESHRTWS